MSEQALLTMYAELIRAVEAHQALESVGRALKILRWKVDLFCESFVDELDEVSASLFQCGGWSWEISGIVMATIDPHIDVNAASTDILRDFSTEFDKFTRDVDVALQLDGRRSVSCSRTEYRRRLKTAADHGKALQTAVHATHEAIMDLVTKAAEERQRIEAMVGLAPDVGSGVRPQGESQC